MDQIRIVRQTLINRDWNEKIIKLIKEKADDYDMELKQKADSLMQNNLQNKKNK